MRRILSAVLFAASALCLDAQTKCPVLVREPARITFAVDKVEPPTRHCGWHRSGMELARDLHLNPDRLLSDWEPELLANSFADVDDLYDIGEDVLFRMLLMAWCQHRPVVLGPDAIWLVICQQVSHCIHADPQQYRDLLVRHEGKKELAVETNDLLSEQADWAGLVAGFTSGIARYTNHDIATTLVADFSTTGTDERIASEVTLMDVVKPYFYYTAISMVCGIPSITLTGTPEDWRKVLEKTRSLEALGLGWWTSELEPVLEEFIKAAEGNPDYGFWKDIVKKSRPRTIQGPVCTGRRVKLTRFDGWFLKFFPYDNKGRTPAQVTLAQTMLRETVAVPFRYQVVTPDGVVLSETSLELVAGIVGVQEDAATFTMTPKIGWLVRTARRGEAKTSPLSDQARLQEVQCPPGPALQWLPRSGKWSEGPLP